MYLVDTQVTFNQHYAIRFALCYLVILLPHPAVETVLLKLKAIFVFAGLRLFASVTAAGAPQRCAQRWQQQYRNVGLKVAADYAVQIENHFDPADGRLPDKPPSNL